MLEPLSLPDVLRLPQGCYRTSFCQTLSDFPTLTPVEGEVTVSHRGNFLEADGSAHTIVTLTCCRCLQAFNLRLDVTFEEILWIEESAVETRDEVELTSEDLVETIAPNGTFDLEDWVYQQLWLAMPQRQLCDTTCTGISVQSRDSQPTDSRWSALEQLKHQFWDS